MFEALAARSRAAVRDERPFVMLPELRFAWAAAQRLVHPGRAADRQGQLTTLVGPRGSGKTKLVSQVLSEFVRKQPRLKFAVLSAGEWLKLVQMEVASPAESYPAIVVAEDADRTLTTTDDAEAFARWLDELQQHNVRVLVTLSEPAGQTAAFSPRLVSRLHAGLCVRMPALSVDSRRNFVRGVMDGRRIAVADEVVNWIADQPPGTCRSLCQLVDRLANSGPSKSVTAALAAMQERDSDENGDEQRPALSVIAAEVATEFGVPVGELRSESRDQATQLPRRCAMWLAHEARWPMAQIGRFFGQRTHASVSYSCRELVRQLADAPTLRDRVQRLQSRLIDARREDCG
ncbi:MAG TPA: helix-turn-helix domain-containing protein [Planctomycetaceae bacterium]|nr:helix-turn-helix domain-containing protein [Planctomycetaceae bacterium]